MLCTIFRFILCKGIHLSPVDSPHKGPVMQSFNVSFDVSLKMLLNRQSSSQWFEMPCHMTVMIASCCRTSTTCLTTCLPQRRRAFWNGSRNSSPGARRPPFAPGRPTTRSSVASCCVSLRINMVSNQVNRKFTLVLLWQSFLTKMLTKMPRAHLQVWDMGCLLWVQIDMYAAFHCLCHDRWHDSVTFPDCSLQG